jgi:hypothetical protein
MKHEGTKGIKTFLDLLNVGSANGQILRHTRDQCGASKSMYRSI